MPIICAAPLVVASTTVRLGRGEIRQGNHGPILWLTPINEIDESLQRRQIIFNSIEPAHQLCRQADRHHRGLGSIPASVLHFDLGRSRRGTVLAVWADGHLKQSIPVMEI